MHRFISIVLLVSTFTALSAADGACPPGKAVCPACPACPEQVVADISVDALKQAITDKQVVLLDANGSASFAKGRLPGAIDFEANANDLAKALPADKGALIVAYCGGPKCNAWKSAAKAATALGYTNVKHFSGGLSGWKAAGEQLIAMK